MQGFYLLNNIFLTYLCLKKFNYLFIFKCESRAEAAGEGEDPRHQVDEHTLQMGGHRLRSS